MHKEYNIWDSERHITFDKYTFTYWVNMSDITSSGYVVYLTNDAQREEVAEDVYREVISDEVKTKIEQITKIFELLEDIWGLV